MNRKQYEKGAALITALVMMAVAASIAVTLSWRQHANVKRTEQLLLFERLRGHIDYVQAWAIAQLRVATEDSFTANNQPWAQPLKATVVGDGVQVSGDIVDLQGRFNLNNIGTVSPSSSRGQGDDDVGARHRVKPTDIVMRLLRLAPTVSAGQAKAIAFELEQWLRGQLGVSSDGNSEYQRGHYQAAHLPMKSVTELRLIAGVGPELMQALQEDLMVLPISSGAVTININTASERLLAAVLDLPPDQLGALVADRPYTDMRKFEQLYQQQVAKEKQLLISDILTVRSDYFLVTAHASIKGDDLLMYSILHRLADGSVDIIWQSLGTL